MSKNNISSNRLLYAILIGIGIGIVLGGLWPEAAISIRFIGELFLKGLLMLVVPLVMTSMVAGVSGLGDVRRLGGIGGKTVAYYLITTAMSVSVGIVMVNIIQPGSAGTEEERIILRGGELQHGVGYHIKGNRLLLDGADLRKSYDERYMVILLDQQNIRGVVVKSDSGISVSGWTDINGVPATPRAQGAGIRVDLAVAERVKGKKRSIGAVLREVVLGLIPSNLFSAMANTEVLPLIVFSLVFGAVLTTMGEPGRNVIVVFEGINGAIMKIIHLLMLLALVGIGALIAGRLGEAGGLSGFLPELLKLSKYAATVIIGLAVHGFIILPLILIISREKRGAQIPEQLILRPINSVLYQFKLGDVTA